MPLYRWYQDNHSVTIDVSVPPGTPPTGLRLLLSKRRFALKYTDERGGAFLVQRETYALINPPCTDCYTMPEMAPEESAVVRVVLYKAVQAGWISLFAGDPPGQGLVPSPAPMSHAMAHIAALARSREAAAREAAARQAAGVAIGTQSRVHQTWRSGCYPIQKKTPGGIKIHYERNSPTPTEGGVLQVAASIGADSTRGRAERVRQPWSTVRRHVPELSAVEVYASMLQTPPTLDGERPAAGDAEAYVAGEDAGRPMPSRSEAAAARAAIEAVRKGEAPEVQPSHTDPTSSDDEAEGLGASADEIEYPLPGSYASCDACGQVVDKYYHCVQCGVLEGFDLCAQCKRVGLWSDKHERRFPNHKLKLVTKHMAPIISQPPKPAAAPPAPPKPPPPPKPLPGTQAISERVVIPLEAKVKYEWTQYTGDVNLSVALPEGTRSRDLIVVVQPFHVSISLKGYGVILRGSFHKGVRHRETVWTLEEGWLRILLVKCDQQSWKKLFPSEAEMTPMAAIKQICDDPEPAEHSYMDLSEEGRSIVDMHRSLKHAMATGDYNYAQELEEEMKMMRFNWGKDRDHMAAG